MANSRIKEVPLTSETPLACILPLQQAAKLANVSYRTLLRNHPKKIIRLASRRLGMRLGDALLIPEKEQQPGMTLGDLKEKEL